MWQIEALPFAALVTCGTFMWVFVLPSRLALLAFLASSASALGVCLYLAWFFRDGMGPDSITTYGMAAWRHFWLGAVIPACVWTVLVVISLLRYLFATRQRPNNSFKPKPLRGSA